MHAADRRGLLLGAVPGADGPAGVVHRLGHLEIGEVSVAIAVSSAHREAAFEAGKWLIDRIKEVVPIWKKENWADGTCEWVHPGLDASIMPGGDAAP